MSYEWHAAFALRARDRKDLEDVMRGRARFSPVDDPYARLQLLAQSVEDGSWNTEAKTRYCQERLVRTDYTDYAQAQLDQFQALGFHTPALGRDDLACLPGHSFFLYLPFKLEAPYISKDDEPFYVHENPVRKEHVIRVPLVSSTGWKGAFRAALRRRLTVEDDADVVVRLTGNVKGATDDFRRGRLGFYPTYLDALEVGVINPHQRETGAGTQPIYIEQVPRGARGVFALLYTPIVPDTPQDPLPSWEDALGDLALVGRASYSMLAELGFGAKTASGMGRAASKITGGYLLIQPGQGLDAVLRIDLDHLRTLNELRQRVEQQMREGGDD